jgi:hypothetical protein
MSERGDKRSKSSHKDRERDRDKSSSKKKKHKKDKDKKSKSSKSSKRRLKESRRKDQSDSSSEEWSAGDSKVSYGSAGRLSHNSWENRSQELYYSDREEGYPLNAYHIESRPRIMQIRIERNFQLVNLDVHCQMITGDADD